MSGWAWTAKCRIAASYGRKLVETIARPFARANAHLMISSGAAARSSLFQRVSSVGVTVMMVIERNQRAVLSPPHVCTVSGEIKPRLPMLGYALDRCRSLFLRNG